MAAQLHISQPYSAAAATVHSGPAGSSYTTIRSAGRELLFQHCDNFPNTTKSFVLPPSSKNKFCEPQDQPRPNLTKKEENRLRGMQNQQDGEKHEKTISDLFVKMIKQIDLVPSILVLKNISVDNDHKSHTMAATLMSEIPGLTFQGENTRGENDVLVLVKDIGAALIEVKRSTSHRNVETAEDQLKRLNFFIQCIFTALSGDSTRTFPIVQLIAVPEEATPTPTTPTSAGSRFLFKDICNDFNAYWRTIIIDELRTSFAAEPFTSKEFEELSETLVGVWGSKTVRAPQEKKRFEIVYEDNESSLAQLMTRIDLQLDTAALTTSEPLSNLIPTKPNEVFQTSTFLKSLYLSPRQKELFDLHQQCIARGAAGTGKTVVLLFKLLHLVAESDFRDILILAPFPHNLRIRYILLVNGHMVQMINKFPPPSDHTSHLNNTRNIYIMTLDNFFHVECDTLMSYDLTRYHLFVDDLQSLYFYDWVNECDLNVNISFYDVGDFIDKWYESFCNHGRYLWVLMDLVQGWLSSGEKFDGKVSQYFFLTPQHKRRNFKIPILHLDRIMRNTTDITTLSNEFRDRYINDPDINASSHVLPTPSMGHNICGQVPTYHHLQQNTDKQNIIPFIIERIRGELMLVTRSPYSLPLSQVAILWEGYNDKATREKYIPAIQTFLNSEFNTTGITIEKQINTNNTHDIIMDVGYSKIPSFESAYAIYIMDPGSRFDYNFSTRARTHLTIIDPNNKYESDTFTHVHHVYWKPHNNTFIKYQPHNNNDNSD